MTSYTSDVGITKADHTTVNVAFGFGTSVFIYLLVHCALYHTTNDSKITVKFVSCYHGVPRPHHRNVGDDLQIRRVLTLRT
jgi:hypothetical protein